MRGKWINSRWRQKKRRDWQPCWKYANGKWILASIARGSWITYPRSITFTFHFRSVPPVHVSFQLEKMPRIDREPLSPHTHLPKRRCWSGLLQITCVHSCKVPFGDLVRIQSGAHFLFWTSIWSIDFFFSLSLRCSRSLLLPPSLLPPSSFFLPYTRANHFSFLNVSKNKQ